MAALCVVTARAALLDTCTSTETAWMYQYTVGTRWWCVVSSTITFFNHFLSGGWLVWDRGLLILRATGEVCREMRCEDRKSLGDRNLLHFRRLGV